MEVFFSAPLTMATALADTLRDHPSSPGSLIVSGVVMLVLSAVALWGREQLRRLMAAGSPRWWEEHATFGRALLVFVLTGFVALGFNFIAIGVARL